MSSAHMCHEMVGAIGEAETVCGGGRGVNLDTSRKYVKYRSLHLLPLPSPYASSIWTKKLLASKCGMRGEEHKILPSNEAAAGAGAAPDS